MSGGPVLLVTGFGPFAGYPDNPSGAIAAAADGLLVWGTRVVGRAVPVHWRAAWPLIADAVAETAPDGLLCLGVCPHPFFRLELMAKNLAPPDTEAAGEMPPADGWMRVDPKGPPAYWTGLPVDWLTDRLEERRVRLSARNSDTRYAAARLWPDTGFYLCNQVFYLAMHHLGVQVRHCGFVHVPRPADPEYAAPGPFRDEVLSAGAYLVHEFARWLASPDGGEL
jgi:pyroglutamyl-peptidase